MLLNSVMQLRNWREINMRKDYLEQSYPIRIRTVFLSVMTLFICLFYFFPRIVESEIIIEEAEYTEILKVELVTQIQQQQKFKSSRPAIPIEADEDILFNTPIHKKWQATVNKLGVDVWQLAPGAGHA